MDIDFALLADNAFVDANGRIHIQGIFDRIRVANYPARQGSLTIALGLLAHSEDAGDHEVHFDLVDDQGSVVISGAFQANLTLRIPAGEDRIRLPLFLKLEGIVFPQPGRYTFRIGIDGQQIAHIPVAASLLPTAVLPGTQMAQA